jgi:hypothetical protein
MTPKIKDLKKLVKFKGKKAFCNKFMVAGGYWFYFCNPDIVRKEK